MKITKGQQDLTKMGLTSEDLGVFEAFYRRRIAEAGGAKDDVQELDIARDILSAAVNDGLTPTSDGGASYVRRGAMDWSDMANIEAAQAAVGGGQQVASPKKAGAKGGGLFQNPMVQTVGVIAMILLGLAWFFWPAGNTKHGNTQQAAGKNGEDVALAAEGDPDGDGVYVPTATPRPTLEAELLSEVVSGGAKVKNLVVPRTLEIKGVGFAIQPINIKVGDWLPPDLDRAVTWVNGTVINYVMGMNATVENKELLASLQAGDQFLLRMSTGQAYRFVYADTIRVAPQASEVYGQSRPSLTLVLLGSNEESRIVVRALYVPDADLISLTETSSPVKSIGLNQRIVLDERVAVTFLGNEVVPAPDTLRGYAYMGVNCIIEYIEDTTVPLLTSSFIHYIEFEGLTHPMVTVNKSHYPALPEALQPRTPITATLVYAVPENNLRQEMLWGFIGNPAIGTQAQAVLPPYEGPLTPVVEVANYALDGAGKAITLTLKITAALHDVELTPSSVQIQGGMLSPTGNHFPWEIASRETKEFELILSPDKGKKITIVVLDQGIEMSY